MTRFAYYYYFAVSFLRHARVARSARVRWRLSYGALLRYALICYMLCAQRYTAHEQHAKKDEKISPVSFFVDDKSDEPIDMPPCVQARQSARHYRAIAAAMQDAACHGTCAPVTRALISARLRHYARVMLPRDASRRALRFFFR